MIIKGNSIAPCPIAMSGPAFSDSYPFAIAAASTGPGIITPDREIITTMIKNSIIT
jgi:hypothetical protein